mgnify:CR=1 FL=1
MDGDITFYFGLLPCCARRILRPWICGEPVELVSLNLAAAVVGDCKGNDFFRQKLCKQMICIQDRLWMWCMPCDCCNSDLSQSVSFLELPAQRLQLCLLLAGWLIAIAQAPENSQ